MASTSKVNDQSDENTAEDELSPLNSDSDTDIDERNDKQYNSDKNSDDDLKTKDEPEDSKSEKKVRKLKSRRRRKLKRRESSSLDRTNSVDTISEKSGLSAEGKKLRKRKQQKVNKFFIDPNGAIERKLEQKYVELEELLNRQFVERKTNLTHLHIGQMEVLRQQYNLSCHGLPPTGVHPYTEGPRRRPHSAHHSTPAWEGESDEAYSAIRQIQQMSKFPGQKRKVRSKSAKSRRETYSDTESRRQNNIDINLETASLSSARSPRSRRKRGTSSDQGSQRESTSPSVSPSRGYIPTDNQLRDTDNRRIKEWLRKKNIELRKQRAAERAEKKEKRKESILKENEKIIARETGRSKVEEWMNQKRREAIEQKKAERLRHRQLEEEQKEREAKKKMEFVQGKSWMRPASAPASRSKGKGLIASSTDDPSTSTDSQTSRPVPHPPSSKLMYKRSSAGRVRLRAKSSEKIKSSDADTKPPTEKSLDSSQLTYSEWLEKKRLQDAEKKKAETEANSKAAAKSDSDLENLLPDLHKNRVNKVLKSKKRVDSGLRSEDENQTPQDAEIPNEAFLTVSGAKAELTTRYSYPRPQSAKLPSPQPCKSPKRPKSAHPRVDAIMDEEEKDEMQENPFHLPFPAHLGLPKEVAKTQSKVFPDRVAAERKSIEAETASDEESNALVVQEINNGEEQIEEEIPEEPEEKVEEIEEESPRVGASFFKTDPDEEEEKDESADPVNVEPPPAIQEPDAESASFLDTSQEKLEPDKRNGTPINTENPNGNNNNSNPSVEISPEVATGGEVNVTELPSEKIPTLEANDNDIPKEVIDYKEDIFMIDSDEEEEAEESLDSEQQVVEKQQDVNETHIPTDEDDQQTIVDSGASNGEKQVPDHDSLVASAVEEASFQNEQPESQYDVIEESELKDEASETTQDSLKMTEQNAESGLHGDPAFQQDADDRDNVETQLDADTNTQQDADDKEDSNSQQKMSDNNLVTQQEEDLVTQQELDNETQTNSQQVDDPKTQQEMDVTEDIPETIDEEIEEEIDDKTVSQDEQYFLDNRQSKHEPDKLEFLEQVMDTLPEVDDDSKGETSSLEETVHSDTDEKHKENLSKIPHCDPNNVFSFVQFSQRYYEAEPKAMSMVEEPDKIKESPEEPIQIQDKDKETQPESAPNEMTNSDAVQQKSDEHQTLKDHETHQAKLDSPESSRSEESLKLESGEPFSEAEGHTSSSPPKPLTPTLGRHLSNEELLANIQAGKKLISIPYSSDENEDDQQTQLEEGAPADGDLQDQFKEHEPVGDQDPSQVQTTQQEVLSGSDLPNELDLESPLTAVIVSGQNQVKEAAVEQIETGKTLSTGLSIPTELQKDSEVIQEQKDLRKTALDEIVNKDLEAKNSSGNTDQRETNTDHNLSSVDVKDCEKDTKIINNQEALEAETMEELNVDTQTPLLTPMLDNSNKKEDAEQSNKTDHVDDNHGPVDEFAKQEFSDERQGKVDDIASKAARENSDEDVAKESHTGDNDAKGRQAYVQKSADSNDTDPQNKIVDTNAEGTTESEDEMARNLQKRLQKLRSYDDAEFPVMHQSIHEYSSAREIPSEPDTADSDTETDNSYQSPNNTPEPQQGSKSLSESFKRGLQQSTLGDDDKVTSNNIEPRMSTSDQPVDLQSNLTQEAEQTEIPEELSSPNNLDNQDKKSLGQHQNGFEDQNSTPVMNNDTAVLEAHGPSTMHSDEELSAAESNVSSDEVNNNKVKADDQTVLDNHDKIVESLSSMKSSIDQTNDSKGDVSIGENETEKLKNLANEFNLVHDNRVEQDGTDLNDNIKPILSSRDDNSANDSQSSRQKKVSFSNRPIIIQEGVNQSDIDTDSDAVGDVLRTMI